MSETQNFDDIRPYRDEEVRQVLDFLQTRPRFYQVMGWLYPNLDKTGIAEMMGSINTIAEFQENISGPAFKVITQMTTGGLTFTNFSQINPEKAHLFLSNHRDIVLDSALLNVSLMEKGHRTTKIAIGDNLLQNPTVQGLVRLNKNFIVHRNVNPKEQLAQSRKLSEFIRHSIEVENEGVWIAHREGRSKDGDDRTAGALLKMLAMSGPSDLNEALGSLNILPMACSYEYDPCDIIKANELYERKNKGTYRKKPGEDYKSMLAGIQGHKGRVNIAVGKPIHDILEATESIANRNDRIREIARQIDLRMHLLYKLWPVNFIAYDVLHGTSEYKSEYTNIQRITFNNYLRGRTIRLAIRRRKPNLQREGFMGQIREILLRMYANPVINRMEAMKELNVSIPD